MQDKKAMLAAMMNGIPTIESEAIRRIAEKADNKKPIPQTYLQEQNYLESLPSAVNVDYNEFELKQRQLLGNEKGLPPVSDDDLSYFFGDKKGQPRVKPKREVTVESIKNINNYFEPSAPKPLINESEDRFENVNMVDVLRKKYQASEALNQKKESLVLPPLTPDLKKIVESYVYEILSEIIGEANDHLVNREQIKIQIGESLFIGNLQQALVMPDKK